MFASFTVRRVIFLLVLLLAGGFAFAKHSVAAQTNSPEKKTEAPAQNPAAPAALPPEKSSDSTPQVPAQLTLLETSYRFEADGSSRKEVHTLVKINSELGVRQFAHLNFDYNRAFETVEIPLVRVTHASGGTADVLPSAITDTPNPAVANAPAYQDVRVKSVRILGLQPTDTLEYRVITNVLPTHPLAPDFWLAHSFDRSGVVAKESFTIDLPAARRVDVHMNPATPATLSKSGEGASERAIYHWVWPIAKSGSGSGEPEKDSEPDIALSTVAWEPLSIRLDEMLTPGAKALASLKTYEESMAELSSKPSVTPEVKAKAVELTGTKNAPTEKLKAIYDFVSQKITTVDLPLGSTEFKPRLPAEIISSGYATPEDKFVLFAALSSAVNLTAKAALTGYCDPKGAPRLSTFNHLLVEAGTGEASYWLDPSLEVAPFGMVSPIQQKCVFVLNRVFFVMNSTGHEWQPFDRKLPFDAIQRVNVDAELDAAGKLTAKVKYVMRGDNELLLRIAFHESPREKWKSLAQLLSLSDGFRGQIDAVSASDPLETTAPFTVEYTISQPKFIDWSKKSLRVPALLPNVALPDPPAAGAAVIDLGTPLDVETSAVLRLPAGVMARQAPTGTSVSRDYAAFSSKYSMVAGGSEHPAEILASRHVGFLLRTIPGTRAADYGAFVRAVQNDAAQGFVVDAAATPVGGAAKP